MAARAANLPRRVFAMARPRRSSVERDLVRALATGKGSVRCRASRLAGKAVAAFMACDCEDPMQRALAIAQASIEGDQLVELVTGEDCPIGSIFQRERVRRFEARGCRQLSAGAWQAETAEIAVLAENRLTRRYRDFLK